VGETTASILVAGAPGKMAASHHLVEQGRMPPPVGHRPQLGGFLLCASSYLGLLLIMTGLYLLIGVGLCLLQM
jgi:hypothetical protein